MSDSYLLVPMQLDIMVLNVAASVDTPFMRFQMDYTQLNLFNSPEPAPFSGASLTQPAAGIYLHWTLPKPLRHGIYQDDGSTQFPLVPNRWLVVRVQNGVDAQSATKAWIVESDYCSDTYADPSGSNPSGGTSPYVDPKGPQKKDAVPPLSWIGRAYPFDSTLKGIPVQENPFLRAVGPGNISFASFSPGVQNVFAFYDDVTAADNSQIEKATFSYYVVGWYSDPKHDPLAGSTWEADAEPSGKHKNSWSWTTGKSDFNSLAQMIP